MIPAVSSSFTPISMPSLDGLTGATKAGGTTGTTGTTGAANGFGGELTNALGSLQSTQATSDNLASQVATGQLTDIQDYMIAANKAEIATQLTVAVRNKAVDAFNQIMNMQV